MGHRVSFLMDLGLANLEASHKTLTIAFCETLSLSYTLILQLGLLNGNRVGALCYRACL